MDPENRLWLRPRQETTECEHKGIGSCSSVETWRLFKLGQLINFIFMSINLKYAYAESRDGSLNTLRTRG